MYRYRLIHFVVDPYTDRRVAVAAVVTKTGAKCLVVRLSEIPSAAVLGGRAEERIAKMILGDLPENTVFDRLPDSCGPHAVLGPIRDIPADVEDYGGWIRALLERGARGF